MSFSLLLFVLAIVSSGGGQQGETETICKCVLLGYTCDVYTHTISIYYDEYYILHACNHTVTMKFAHGNYNYVSIIIKYT